MGTHYVFVNGLAASAGMGRERALAAARDAVAARPDASVTVQRIRRDASPVSTGETVAVLATGRDTATATPLLPGETVAPAVPVSQGANAPTLPELRAVAVDGDGGEQFPAMPTMTPAGPGRVRYARRLPDGRERLRNPDGRPLRMNGDCAAFKGPDPLVPILRLWFNGAWYDVPSIAQLMEWSFEGVAETPEGSRVEPDAPESWLTLIGVI